MTEQRELQRLLAGNAAFTPPENILSGLAGNVRTTRPEGLPHSISEELWHMIYWQDIFLRAVRLEPISYPAHSAEGWRRIDALSDAEWDDLGRRFLQGLAEASAVSRNRYEISTTLEEPSSGVGRLTTLEVLMNLAVHNAYHLGRIVQLRQISGHWPPEGGGDSW